MLRCLYVYSRVLVPALFVLLCLRACVPAYAHVFTLCPYACNRRQLLLCFCTPVGQFVRLYACVNELLTTVCLYAGIVLVEMHTLLCASVDA